MMDNSIEQPGLDAVDVGDYPNLDELCRIVEAVILVSVEPASEILLAQIAKAPVDQVAHACETVSKRLGGANSGVEMVKVAGGWRYQTAQDLAEYVTEFALSHQSQRLSQAALETVAIVAYKQPVSRAQMSAIRGVNVDGVLKTLVDRGYVQEVGQAADAGRASLYGTTPLFLEQIGLVSLDDLVPLTDFMPSSKILEALETTLSPSESQMNSDTQEPASTQPADEQAGSDGITDLGDPLSLTPESLGGSSIVDVTTRSETETSSL